MHRNKSTLLLLSPLQRSIGLHDFCNTFYSHHTVAGYNTAESTVNKVKHSLERSGQAVRFPGVEVPTFQDSWHIKVVRLSAVYPLPFTPQEMFVVLVSIRVWVDPRAVMHSEIKIIPVTPSEIEPATLQFVAQCLNQLYHCVPPWKTVSVDKITSCILKLIHEAYDFGLFCPNVEASITVSDETSVGSDSQSRDC
jgi:hypothetical protein